MFVFVVAVSTCSEDDKYGRQEYLGLGAEVAGGGQTDALLVMLAVAELPV